MKLITNSTDLKTALDHLKYAVSTRATMPIIENVLLTVDKEAVTLTATDLNITISATCKLEAPCKNANGEKLLLPYNKLKEILSLFGTEPVTIAFGAGQTTELTFEDSKFNLGLSEDVTDFPKTPEVPETCFALETIVLQHIQRAALTASTDELRPAMKCVCIELSKHQAVVVATDAHQLYKSEIQLSAPIPVEGTQELLLPVAATKALKNLDGNLTLGYNTQHVCIGAGNVTIWVRMVDAKFPAYREILKTASNEPNLGVYMADFALAVGKAFIFSNPTTHNVRLKPAKETLKLITENAETGQGACVSIDCSAEEGIVSAISFNGKLLLRMVDMLHQKGVHTDINVFIESANKAAIFKTEAEPETLVLIMPLMID